MMVHRPLCRQYLTVTFDLRPSSDVLIPVVRAADKLRLIAGHFPFAAVFVVV